MIGIIDYKAGNLASVSNALHRIGVHHFISWNPEELETADAIIFPGVGHAGSAMNALKVHNTDQWLKSTSKPILGICLGMQLLFEHSEEGNTSMLGLVPGTLKLFPSTIGKVPHMGWNTIKTENRPPILEGIDQNSYFYFVHSFYAPISSKFTVSTSNYGFGFSAVVSNKNYVGVQFHPEKSGKLGERLLHNFSELKTDDFS